MRVAAKHKCRFGTNAASQQESLPFFASGKWEAVSSRGNALEWVNGNLRDPDISLFVVYRVRDLEAMIGMVVPTHPHAVASLALHARQSVSSFHSLVKRLVKAKSLVEVLNCLIRFKDMNASIRLTIRGISVDSEIASVIRHLRPRLAAILVVQRLEIRPLGLALTATIPTTMTTRARAAPQSSRSSSFWLLPAERLSC